MNSGRDPQFVVGDEVFISTLKATGIIEAIARGGDCRVRTTAGTVRCHLSVLREPPPKRAVSSEELILKRSITISGHRSPSSHRSSSLDLHGLFVDEALRRLEEHISRAVLDNLSEVEVIHGVGSGKVRDAVHLRLAELPVVKRFELNPYNRGTTRVFL